MASCDVDETAFYEAQLNHMKQDLNEMAAAEEETRLQMQVIKQASNREAEAEEFQVGQGLLSPMKEGRLIVVEDSDASPDAGITSAASPI